jgi:death-on-curing protein
MNKIDFLLLDEVLALHGEQIELHGGSHGLRDAGLLQSALAMPEATFGGSYLHETISEMAAAYLYHLVKNHPFVDGNKRIGLKAALVFLRINQVRVVAGKDELTQFVLDVAEGKVNKAQVAVFLQEHAAQVRR